MQKKGSCYYDGTACVYLCSDSMQWSRMAVSLVPNMDNLAS